MTLDYTLLGHDFIQSMESVDIRNENKVALVKKINSLSAPFYERAMGIFLSAGSGCSPRGDRVNLRNNLSHHHKGKLDGKST